MSISAMTAASPISLPPWRVPPWSTLFHPTPNQWRPLGDNVHILDIREEFSGIV